MSRRSEEWIQTRRDESRALEWAKSELRLNQKRVKRYDRPLHAMKLFVRQLARQNLLHPSCIAWREVIIVVCMVPFCDMQTAVIHRTRVSTKVT